MDKETFKAKMESIFPGESYDSGVAHSEADQLMVETLESLGYGCSVFSNAEIWYA